MKSLFRFLTFMFTVGLAFANPSKLSKDLTRKDPTALVNAIVQFKQVPSELQHQKVKDKGGVLRSKLDVIKGAQYSLPASALETLMGDPDVVYITPDRPVAASLNYGEPAVNGNISLQYGWDGTGVGIAVIDSGITDHPDLKVPKSSKSRIVYRQSFIPGGTDDAFEHGTHIAGILAGNGANSSGPQYTATFKGIAPNARLINLRVLDENGQGQDSTVIQAIQEAISLKDTYNIRVINLSLGRPVFESYTLDPLCQAVEAAWQAGIVVVVAAGNNGRDDSLGTNGYATITAPGNDPYVITVGAMKTMGTATRGDDLIASYSSKGPSFIDHIVKPDIVAPGNRIISLLADRSQLEQGYAENLVALSYYTVGSSSNSSTSYYKLSGTSMATPMVSGAAALLLQQNPSLTPDQVKARLMKAASKNFPASSIATDPATGVSYTSQYDIFTIGAGYLDTWAALNNTDLASGSALSPTAMYDSETGTVYVLSDSSAIWGISPVWEYSIIWGNSVFATKRSAVWGNSAPWGNSTTEDFNSIWATKRNAVWGNSSSAESLKVTIRGEN